MADTPTLSLAQVSSQTRSDQVQATAATPSPAKADSSPATANQSTQCANWNTEYQKHCAVRPKDVPDFVADRLAAVCAVTAKALVEACAKNISPTTLRRCSSSDSSSGCDVRAQQASRELDYLIRYLPEAGRCHFEIDEGAIMTPPGRFPAHQ